MKAHKLAFIIGLILFFIPFFWLKPGEMNLGGDAGRLYFYDPGAFIQNYAIYNFTPSGKGVESIGYVFLPFTLLLFLLKFIFQSSTTLIAIFNGVILSTAFLSVYFIVRELIGVGESVVKGKLVTYSAIIAGFFYIFSQELIYAGWERPIITHNQLFLNPLMFFLLLRYLLTKNYVYIIVAFLTSVIFTANFAYVGAPTFFAFYPLVLIFLLFYIKFIRKLSIPFKGLGLGIVLFLLIHAFHLFPESSAVFSFGSPISKTVFSLTGGSSREGLDYFTAIAANTNVSLIWLGAAQFQKGIFLTIFMLFPLTLFMGLFLNKGKTFLLTGLFFLVAMFFASANITDAGLTFYKQLFKLPGFSMFRNFHGQWLYIFIFFYTLFFGQALAIIANRLKKPFAVAFLIINVIIIVSFGIPLISGAASIIEHADTGVRFAIRMDPLYEKVLNYFRTADTDSKTLTLPLTGPGYQALQGKDGGLYQGLPTISYLTGKSDFSGFESLKPFQLLLLESMKNKDYVQFNRILSIMNIQTIYHNSDPYIYDDVVKDYLYDFVSQYSPQTQNEYKAFIEKLPIVKRTDFGDKYHIYSIENSNSLPHIFTTTEEIYTNDPVELSINPSFPVGARMTPVFAHDGINENDTVLYGIPDSALFELSNNTHLHRHEPFISVKLDSPMYRFALLKEKYGSFKVRNNSTQYLNFDLFLLSKRVFEVVKFADTMDVLKASWKEPKIWEIYKVNAFNSWEASLTRYEKGMDRLITWVGNSNESEVSRQADRIKISEQLFRHEIELLKVLKSVNKKNDEKAYLHTAIETTFDRLFQKVNIPIYNPSEYFYHLPGYANREGYYAMYLDTKDIPDTDLQSRVISIGSESLPSGGNAFSPLLTEFKSQYLDENTDLKFTALTPQTNLIREVIWNNSGSQEQSAGLVTLTVNNSIGENSKGLMVKIPGWTEKKKYFISFDYLTFGDDFIFSFYDKKKSKDELKKFSYKQFFEKRLNSKDWKTNQTIISAEENSVEEFLQISAFSSREISRIRIKNLSITEIKFPQILFRKIVNKTQDVGPKIKFSKINPTKYKIDVINAHGPYRLVFLESFNPNWKLIDPVTENDSFRGLAARLVSKVLRSITSVFIPQKVEGETVTTEYFNGEVKEGKHRNIFLEPSTFETWGMLNIAAQTHREAFGYANVWSIMPEDMNGRSDYTLILEIRTQKQFYQALTISILTIIFLITYITRVGFRKHAKQA